MPEYRFRGFHIPAHMMEALERYIEHHSPVGDFLSAVIRNDLRTAVEKADDVNIRNLPAYIAYLYNEAPSACWGSPERLHNWLQPAQSE